MWLYIASKPECVAAGWCWGPLRRALHKTARRLLLWHAQSTHFKMPQYYVIKQRRNVKEWMQKGKHGVSDVSALFSAHPSVLIVGTHTHSEDQITWALEFMCKIFKQRTRKNDSREILHKLHYSLQADSGERGASSWVDRQVAYSLLVLLHQCTDETGWVENRRPCSQAEQ